VARSEAAISIKVPNSTEIASLRLAMGRDCFASLALTKKALAMPKRGDARDDDKAALAAEVTMLRRRGRRPT
jgi:hypothetical protein